MPKTKLEKTPAIELYGRLNPGCMYYDKSLKHDVRFEFVDDFSRYVVRDLITGEVVYKLHARDLYGITI